MSSNNETSLFIGVNPRHHGDDIIATFTGKNFIPLSWYFLFSPEDVKSRREEFPDQLSPYKDNASLEELEQFLEDSVAFKSNLPDAKSRLSKYREVFSTIPYLWSYFKVIDILDHQLESFIEQLESSPQPTIVHRSTPHPETNLSQVQLQPEDTALNDKNSDNPFAALEDFGQLLDHLDDEDEEQIDSEEEGSFNLSDDELLSALQEASFLDFHDSEDEAASNEILDGDNDFMPVVVYFDKLSADVRSRKLSKIPELLERLMHHARREEEMTRVMQDLVQEIFRDAQSGWRVTGQLAEDFVHGNPASLTEIMLGEPSPFVIINEKLDLEFWTTGTLQSGDERLMYTLTMLPSEKIHRAIKSGTLSEIAPEIGNLLSTTQNLSFPRFTVNLLSESPIESNIWGIRVLIQDISGEFKAATLLISNPEKSWKQEFQERINLPGVLEDWNIHLPVRFGEFSDKDEYLIVFEGARDFEDTFEGFVRWIRRHNIMYRQKFGTNGTIKNLKDILAETNNKQEGQLIFDLLTKLTELGFNSAIDALSDDAIVRKLPWLYS